MLHEKCIAIFLALIYCTFIISANRNDCGERKNVQNKTCAFFNHIKPLRYQVYLDPCINDGNFSGYVHIDLLILRPTKNVSLHSQDITFCDEGVYLTLKGKTNETFGALKSVRDLDKAENSSPDSDEGDLDVSAETVRPCKFIYRRKEQIVTIKFEEVVRPGRYTLEINYIGSINSEAVGVYRRTYKDDDGQNQVMLLTNFFPTSARRIFPCRDEPGIKTEIHFTIQSSMNYTTLMPKTPTTCVEYREDQRWSHSHPVSNISTHQLNFAVLRMMKNLTKTSANKTYITYATATDLKSIKLAQNTQIKAVSIMENLTKINYPLNTLITLVIPEKSEVTSSASLGFITLKKTQSLYNERSGPQKKKDVVLRASRDIVNQWFNHLISPASWKHMWLNDGLTEYFKYYVADKIMPNWRLKDIFVVWELQRKSFIPNKITDSPALNENILDTPEDIQCLLRKSYSSRTVGASLIRMMSHYLSEDIVHSSIMNFLKANKHKAVRPSDFWKSVQDVVDASNDDRYANISVSDIMKSWVDVEFYPIVNVTRNYVTGSIKVSQIPAVTFFGLTENNVTKKWWVPINYASQSNPNFNETFASHWLKPDVEQLVIEGVNLKDWIVLNIQQTGYYRVLYDKENYKRLADFLNSDNYDKIPPINRAQIINDAVQFSLKRHLDTNTFLDLMSYLRKETDYIPWYDAQFIFSFLNYHLSNTHAYPSLKKFSLFLLTPIADKIGYKDRPDDDFSTLLLRRITNYWTCHFGYERCWNNATQQLEAYLDNKKPELDSIDIQDWAQCVGLHGANETIWNRMMDKYQEKSSDDILIYLGCSENPAILNRFLNITVTSNETIPDRQILSVFKAVCLYPSGDDKRINLCLDFISSRFNDIITRLGDSADSLTHFMDLLGSEIRQTSQLNQFNNILSQENATFILDKLNGRLKQTETRISIFEQKANYYDPFLKGKIAQFC